MSEEIQVVQVGAAGAALAQASAALALQYKNETSTLKGQVDTAKAAVDVAKAAVDVAKGQVDTAKSAVDVAKAAVDVSQADVIARQAVVVAAQATTEGARDTAVAQAGVATTKAAESAGSASLALAIFGTADNLNAAQQIMLGYANTAQGAASQAQAYAASAASVAQQDLSGVTAAKLHSSPNAVTAMCLYDVSKDSDGGAWVERVTNTSWFQEALNGTYLPGGFASEMDARDYLGSYQAASLLTGDSSTFTGGVGSWAAHNGNLSVSAPSGRLRITQVGATGTVGGAALSMATVTGQRYQVVLDFVTTQAGGQDSFLGVGNAVGSNTLLTANMGASLGRKTYSFVATATTSVINFYGSSVWAPGMFAEIDNITVKPVSFADPAGAWYQSRSDGKFYRLWKNLLRNSADISAAGWLLANSSGSATRVGNAVTFGASVNDSVYLSGVGLNIPVGVPISGSVTFGAGSSGNIRLSVFNGAGSARGTVNVTLTGAEQEVKIEGFSNDVAGVSSGVQILNNSGGVAGASFTVVRASIEIGPVVTAYESKAADTSQVEVFRGNKAEFPKLAAIVAEASNITIYDLTEPGRPMWMRFQTGSGRLIFGNSNVSCAAMLNGVLALGDGTYDLHVVNFPNDSALRYGSYQVSTAYAGSIATRNTAPTIVNTMWPIGAPVTLFASRNINAVAMCVMPDAPVDPVTGLQVPTIACATAGGISIIQPDGTVRNSSLTSNFTHVGLTPRLLTVSMSSSSSFWVATDPGRLGASFSLTALSGAAAPGFNNTGSSGTLLAHRNLVVKRGGAPSLSMMRLHESTPAQSLVAEIGATYNTGWWCGDIRRVWCADTVAGATEANLVTNGDNEAALMTFGTASVAGGVFARVASPSGGGYAASLESNSSSSGAHQVAFGTTAVIPAGKAIEVSGRFYVPTGGVAHFKVFDNSDGSWFGVSSNVKDGWVSFSVTRPAKATQWNLGIGNNSNEVITSGVTAWYVDDLVIKEAVADRCYKAKPATIYGTLTRTAVAAGAQLVAYSGFSNSNYIQEPYSADLDFGTGAWTCSAVVTVPTTLPASSFPELTGELITNGDFSSGTTGWSTSGGTPSFSESGGVATLANGAAAESFASQAVLTIGRVYKATINRTAVASGGVGRIVFGQASAAVNIYSPMVAGAQTCFGAAAGTTELRIGTNSASSGASISFDDVSVKEVGPAILAERSAASGASIKFGVDALGRIVVTANDGTTTRTVTTTASYNTGTRMKVRASYTTDGTLSISVNGRVVASTYGTPLLTMNNASAVTTTGQSRTLDAPWPGDICLVKWGATVPSAEAMLWMYEAEKQMFRPGAQVTLPDTGSLVGHDYDDLTDTVTTVSAANEAHFNGLVRTSTAAVPAGAYTKAARGSGIKLLARSTTNIGVDVTTPAQNLKEELLRADDAARRARLPMTFDYVGGFTANVTNGSTALASVTGLSVPAGVNLRGVTVTGTGIPASTVITDIVGTTVYISKAATATNTGVSISMLEFPLPTGYEAEGVATAGALKQEGATKDWTRSYDGFIERPTFPSVSPPGPTTWVQVRARRTA